MTVIVALSRTSGSIEVVMQGSSTFTLNVRAVVTVKSVDTALLSAMVRTASVRVRVTCYACSRRYDEMLIWPESPLSSFTKPVVPSQV
jgi:hypothetical protein